MEEETHTGGESLGQKIHGFFENPQTKLAIGVQMFIVLLIFLSVILTVVELFYPETAQEHSSVIDLLNKGVLVVFTLEYVLRVASAPRMLYYASRPLNIVDFLSVFPSLIEIAFHFGVEYETMGLRVVRIFRFARLIRGLRLLRFYRTLSKVFKYQETILEAITPMILLGVALKAIIWFLESRGFWFTNPSLGELFSIIGFALGIILSQKISLTYDKFIQVQEASVRIYSGLQTLRMMLNTFRPNFGTKVTREWSEAFLKVLEDTEADNYALHPYNDALFQAVAELEKAQPDQYWSLQMQIVSDASFCLNKKVRLTPRAYDLLVHQATVVYLLLIAIFIPGWAGMISILVATYILYGLYHVTQDLDSIVGGDYNLINIDLSELKYFAAECRKMEDIAQTL